MSLRTADFFHHVLIDSKEVRAFVDDRIYIPARPTIDEEEDTIPYIIIEPGEVTNNADTKDDGVEGDEDSANVSIFCVAESHDDLIEMAEAVRERCAEAWEENANPELTPIEWSFAASDEMYDPVKPCNYMRLNYNCITKR